MDKLRHYSPLAGRILFAVPLLDFGIYKLRNWEMMRGWLEFEGLPAPGLLLGAAILIEIVAALLLAAGLRVRVVAPLLIGYLIPVHVVLHDFWTLAGAERQSQHEQFFKGMMIIGGLLFLYACGAGAASVDGPDARSEADPRA